MSATIEGRGKATELNDREPVMADVRRGFRYRSSEFSAITLREAQLLHAVAAGEGWVLVIGHPNWGNYEWVYVATSGKCFTDRPYEPRLEADEAWEHSDDDWGGVASALLHGLLHAEGGHCEKCGCCVLPEDVHVRCPQCLDESDREGS